MNLNRRQFLIILGASAGALSIDGCALAEENTSVAQKTPTPASTPTSTPTKTTGAIALPPLPYAYNALEPHIDAATMKFHHDKHHAAYVNNLNTALDKHPELKSQSIETLLRDLNKIPADIRTTFRNNGGGHVNHSMFWQIMKPKGGGEPTGELAAAITKDFGSFGEFQKQFNAAGGSRFGSGWVWLVRATGGKLEITTTPNQDSPISEGKYPIMGNDVWEHAYYLKYQNRRPDYLQAWWNVLNWEEISKRFAASA